MLLLIDYDNIDQAERRAGLDHVLRKAVSLVDRPGLNKLSVRVRLYGGWYEGGMLTRLAQTLGAELRAVSPVRYLSPHMSQPMLIRGELAVSILAAPKALVSNTFRKKGYPRNLQCEKRPWLSCIDNSSCPLGAVQRFVESDSCDASGCAVRPQDILHKQEQKVVDSMMVADLIDYAAAPASVVGVVSRDDDIWPGLYLACRTAAEVIHLSTSSSPRVPKYYETLPAPPYRRINWS